MIDHRPGPVVRTKVLEVREGRALTHEDKLATEEPLEIRLAAPGLPATRLGITMRTPGNDFDLAAGWIVHERIAEPGAITAVRYCTDVELAPSEVFNVVTVELDRPPGRLPVARLLTAACGVCGSESVDDALADLPAVAPVSLAAETILAMPDALRSGQATFDRTGGLHGAGLFDVDGTPVLVREDIGRHNAVDKVIGARLLAGQPIPAVLVLSGRIGFELVQKAVVSRIGAMVAVGAPSSLAVQLAERAGVLMVGFTRGGRFVGYAGTDRIGV